MPSRVTPSARGARLDLVCRRESLPEKVAQAIISALRAGHWTRDLPGERKLCEILQVSRVSVRPALREVERQGWIVRTPGRRRQIRRKAGGAVAPSVGGRIVLLSPLPLTRMEPFVLLGLDLLREMLARRDILLEIETRPDCFGRRPEAALERLCRDFHPDVWLLWRSTASVQEWFHRLQRRHVVVGTAFHPRTSPSVDIDHVATARHAAATLGRLGHRRLAVIVPDSRLAGDSASELGFLAGARKYEGGALLATAIRHDGTPAGIFRCVDRLMAFVPRPTAIFSAGGMQTIAITTRLRQLGVAVPTAVSVISRDDDPALDFVSPRPARYFRPPINFARGVFRQIERQLRVARSLPTAHLILPELQACETLAAASNP